MKNIKELRVADKSVILEDDTLLENIDIEQAFGIGSIDIKYWQYDGSKFVYNQELADKEVKIEELETELAELNAYITSTNKDQTAWVDGNITEEQYEITRIKRNETRTRIRELTSDLAELGVIYEEN